MDSKLNLGSIVVDIQNESGFMDTQHNTSEEWFMGTQLNTDGSGFMDT
jgi:hypothetical protein